MQRQHQWIQVTIHESVNVSPFLMFTVGFCCVKTKYQGCSFITQTQQAKAAKNIVEDRQLTEAGAGYPRQRGWFMVTLRYQGNQWVPVQELPLGSDHSSESASLSGQMVSVSSHAFKIFTPPDVIKHSTHFLWFCNEFKLLLAKKDIIYSLQRVWKQDLSIPSGRTWLAVGPWPPPFSGLGSGSRPLSGRPHYSLHYLICSVISTDLSILHGRRPCLHNTTCTYTKVLLKKKDQKTKHKI